MWPKKRLFKCSNKIKRDREEEERKRQRKETETEKRKKKNNFTHKTALIISENSEKKIWKWIKNLQEIRGKQRSMFN